jgi:hypothetical protein
MRRDICYWLTLPLLFISLIASTAHANEQSGIDDRDLIQIKWKEINVKSPPFGFSLLIYICGVETYQCRVVKDSQTIWLNQAGAHNPEVVIKIAGQKINQVIREQIDRPSSNYQFAIHFYRHSSEQDKELMGITDVPYSELQVEQWQEYKISEPFDSYFDPSKFVNTKFDLNKLVDQDITPDPDGPIDPLPTPPTTGGLDQEEYERILSNLEEIYHPLAQQIGMRLKFIRQWPSPIQDAISGYEEDAEGRIFTMKFPGGLARHELMSVETYTMVACHELGHHLGGPPLFPGGASVEGQADYFASYDCIRRVLEKSGDAHNPEISYQVSPLVEFFCAKAHPRSLYQQRVCQAVAYYGQQVTHFFATKKHQPAPRFATPSLEVATVYYEVGKDPHPPLQCRLDTYLAAALCDQHPITNSHSSVELNQITPCQTKEQFRLGERPLCWFIPQH